MRWISELIVLSVIVYLLMSVASYQPDDTQAASRFTKIYDTPYGPVVKYRADWIHIALFTISVVIIVVFIWETDR